MRINPQVELITAMTLGDGSLERGKSGARYSMAHCLEQGDYLKAKADLLGEGARVQAKTWGEISCLYMKTVMYREWAAVYDELYPQGKKSFGLTQVRRLDALGWAIWFADDGSLDKGKRATIVASTKILREPREIRDFMTAKFGAVSLHQYVINNSELYYFYLTDEATIEFWPYVEESLRRLNMQTKLPRDRR